KVSTRFYAFLREMTGLESDVIVLEDGSTVADFLSAIRGRYGAVLSRIFGEDGLLRSGFAVALNGENVERREWGRKVLRDGDVVVILPPIAGGLI
ncbi:MAG: MoaD family protein, partial [Nitrososphaerota archaeon]